VVAYLDAQRLMSVTGTTPAEEDVLVSVDRQDPIDVVDRQLWRDAQVMLAQHMPADDLSNRCSWCDRPWPCVSRRVAERAEIAAFKPWNEVWTVRHDLRSLGGTPNWRAAAVPPPSVAPYNRGTFY
jgi:hypothetical protein